MWLTTLPSKNLKEWKLELRKGCNFLDCFSRKGCKQPLQSITKPAPVGEVFFPVYLCWNPKGKNVNVIWGVPMIQVLPQVRSKLWPVSQCWMEHIYTWSYALFDASSWEQREQSNRRVIWAKRQEHQILKRKSSRSLCKKLLLLSTWNHNTK